MNNGQNGLGSMISAPGYYITSTTQCMELVCCKSLKINGTTFKDKTSMKIRS